MAIAYSNSLANNNSGGAGGSSTDAFTTNSGDTALYVAVCNRGNGTVTSMAYNGDAMTLIESVTSGAYILYLYYLPNPDIGAYNIVTQTSGTVSNISIGAWSGSGSNISVATPVNTSNSVASDTTLTTNLTSTTGWTVLFAYSVAGGSHTISAGTGSTQRAESEGNPDNIAVYDSNAQVAGSTSMAVTTGSAARILTVMATVPLDITITATDTNVTTESINYGLSFFASDTNTTTDLVSFADWENKPKSTAPSWSNQSKS